MAPTSRLGHSIPCSALAAWPALHPVAFPPPGLCCLFTPPSSLGCTTTGQKSPAAWVWGWPCRAGPARSRLSGCRACTEAGPVADTLFPTRGTPMRPAAAWLPGCPLQAPGTRASSAAPARAPALWQRVSLLCGPQSLPPSQGPLLPLRTHKARGRSGQAASSCKSSTPL